MLSKALVKQAQELIEQSKTLNTKWDIQTVSIAESERIEAEKELDDDPNNIRIVIYTS
jgi:hypothetical protein